jgi:hypothetical protein
MSGFPVTPIVVAIIGSGGLNALVTGGFGVLNRRAADKTRQQDVLNAAREKFVSDVSKALEWLEYAGKSIHGLDADYTTNHLAPPKCNSVADVLTILRRVSHEHPSSEVRALASQLAGSVDAEYGDVNPAALQGSVSNPPVDKFVEWTNLGERLIGALHEKPKDA